MADTNPINKAIDEVTKLAPKVYDDLVQPSSQIIGETAGRTVKALLAPVRGMLWGWERIEDVVTKGVEERLKNVPEENRKAPEPEIAVPVMQALTYTAQNETLREMYLNLLANAMDIGFDKVVHPSFVEIIKQMNSLDAKVFEKLSQSNGYNLMVNPKIGIKDTNKYYAQATPKWFVGWTIDEYTIFDISTCIVRLSKFGLVDLLLDKKIYNQDSGDLKNHSILMDILNTFQSRNPSEVLELRTPDGVYYINEYGKQFKSACLSSQ